MQCKLHNQQAMNKLGLVKNGAKLRGRNLKHYKRTRLGNGITFPRTKQPLATSRCIKLNSTRKERFERLRSRLIARGDKQLQGKDYKNTFSPVVKFATVIMLIALAPMKHEPLHQLDINNAYLH